MQRLIVTGDSAGFHSGILELTPAQAASRNLCLIDLGEGFYQINQPVEFKRGEEIGYDGEINKAQLAVVSTSGDKTKRKK